MALKSRQHFPPNGFVFYEPTTGWHAPQHMPFNMVVHAIIDHRKANSRFNLPTDFETVARALEDYTEARLRSQFGESASQWIVMGSDGSSPPPFSPRLRSGLPGAVVAAGVKTKAVTGIGTIISWLGDGLKPVDQQLANDRATVCVVCPLNVRSEGILKAIATAGDILHSIAEAKADMKLQTPSDDKLQSCAACKCVLATKVWCPIEHIKSGTTQEVFDALDANCWIRKELPQ